MAEQEVPMQRRVLLKLGAGLAAVGGAGAYADASAEPPRRTALSAPPKLLVLGGTNFVGAWVVQLALQRGFEVTLFNRGRTNPWLYSMLDRRRGDRHPGRGAGLSALDGDEHWDAVVDTWQGNPLCVSATAKLLQARTKRYVYISSIAVYGGENFRLRSFDEEAKLPMPALPDSIDQEVDYMRAKRSSEVLLLDQYGDRASILRPYSIVGTDARGRIDIDGDLPTMAAKAYWPVRCRRPGPLLCPGDGQDQLQWTGVADLARFVLHSIEADLGGIYNVSQAACWKDFLAQLQIHARQPAELIWLPAQTLFDHGLASFSDIPHWVWRQESEPGFYAASTAKLQRTGFTMSPLGSTFGPLVDGFERHHRSLGFRSGATAVVLAQREKELLRDAASASL